MLIAESELNRAHLVQDWQAMTGEVHAVAHEARTIRSFVSATATLVAGVASYWRKKSPAAAAKPSLLKIVLKGAGQISTLWTLFRSAGRGSQEK